MKKILLLIILIFAINFGYGQTTLSAGDVAITGLNSDNPDEFSFVLLTDVLNGTQINFTDHGWQSAGVFNTPANGGNNEGVVTWTATADLTCGTQIIITDMGSNVYSATTGSASETNAGFALSESGDQIFVYQGTLAAPTFMYGVNYGNNSGWSEATNTNTSALPSSLTDGVNAIYPGNNDNYNYNCSVVLYAPNILDAISDVSNWTGSNSISRPALSTCGGFNCNKCSSTVTYNGTWSGTPDANTEVIISSNYTTSLGNNITACSLTIDAGVILTVANNTFIYVEHDVVVDGNLIVETQGNFVQNNDSGTFTNNGSSRVNKTTAPKADWFYYTYWSSPVVGETIADAFPNVDGDRRFWFNAANFLDTDGDDIDDNSNDWQVAAGGDVMIPGVGYASTEARFFFGGSGLATFEGAFNTGDINVGISNVPGNAIASWNFIGNPYPSAIDFDAFHAANSTVVDGAAYFWSQATPHAESNGGNEQSNFSKNDYAIYTVGSGGTAGSGTPGASGVIPNQYIPSGQGFFIAGLDNNTVTFTNAMRMADGTSNTQFFKGSKKSKASTNLANRLWIDLTTDNGIFSQILIAYVDGATDENDGLSYDAPKIVSEGYAAILYSSMNSDDKKYVIQGKNIESINEDEIINVGFSSTIEVNTEYSLSIAQIEGDFLTNNSVYIKDNSLNTLHNLSASDYTFTSEEGTFNERFKIVFNANALSTEDINTDKSDALKIIELNDDNVSFTTDNNIKSVKIFDLLGRQLYDFKGSSKSETYNLSKLNSAIYIAKVELSNGITISKKAIKK